MAGDRALARQRVRRARGRGERGQICGSCDLDLEASPSGRHVVSEEVISMAVVPVSGFGRMVADDVVYVTGGCGNGARSRGCGSCHRGQAPLAHRGPNGADA